MCVERGPGQGDPDQIEIGNCVEHGGLGLPLPIVGIREIERQAEIPLFGERTQRAYRIRCARPAVRVAARTPIATR